MKTLLQSLAFVLPLIGTGAQARSIQIPMCTQVAGVAQHKKTGECRSFTNGCQLNELFKSGFQVAGPETCSNGTEFSAALPHSTSLIPVPDDTGVLPTTPSTSTMVCDGQSTLRDPFKHTIRLVVVTGRTLVSGGALIELTQTSTHGKFAPVALLASVRETLKGDRPGRTFTNQSEKFQLYIPQVQPMDTPFLRASVKYGPSSFIARCRTLVY